MREHGLLATTWTGRARGPKAHDGVIVTDRPDQMWGTDATSVLTDEGSATIFFVVDHCTMECLGIHTTRRGTRWEALEALRQAVREAMGGYLEGMAAARGLKLRHDHGSQFVSDDDQADLRFLGIESSPSYVREPEGNLIAVNLGEAMPRRPCLEIDLVIGEILRVPFAYIWHHCDESD
jgi:transposase InsO family protein